MKEYRPGESRWRSDIAAVSAFIDVFRKSYRITRGSYKEHHCAILASKADKRLV